MGEESEVRVPKFGTFHTPSVEDQAALDAYGANVLLSEKLRLGITVPVD